MECIFSNQRSEQSWASKEHLEWMENILCNYCHPFNQCEMIKSYKDAGFWLKSFSLNRGCNLLTLSQLGANLKSQSGWVLFRNNGRQDTLGPKAGVSLTSRSVNFQECPGISGRLLAVCVWVGRCWQTWRVAYQSSRTFWWPFFLERRTDLHIISFPLFIYSFIQQIFIESLSCSKYTCRTPWKTCEWGFFFYGSHRQGWREEGKDVNNTMQCDNCSRRAVLEHTDGASGPKGELQGMRNRGASAANYGQ